MLSKVHGISLLRNVSIYILSIMLICSFGSFVFAKTKASSRKTAVKKRSKKVQTKKVQKQTKMEAKPSAAPKAIGSNQPAANRMPKKELIQFVITDLHRGITRDQRLLKSPRVVTLQVLSPRRQLRESLWKGQSLQVFRMVPLNTPNISLAELFENDDMPDGELNIPELPPIRVAVGSLEIKSVHGMTLQAIVKTDDLASRDLFTQLGEAKVVMIGDLAERPQPQAKIEKPVQRKTRKTAKPTPFERKEMRWQM